MNALQRSLGRVAATEEAKARVKAYLRAGTAARDSRRAGPLGAPRLAAALACLVLLLAGVGGWQVYRTPVSYISIDVNPSIELAVNRFGRVVDTAAYNADGAAVLSGLSCLGKTYTGAIDALAADPLFRSYLDGGGKVVFTVVSDQEGALRRGILGAEGFRACGGEYVQADGHCLQQAHANGLSVGKYYVYEALSQYGSSVTLEDCHHMSFGQLQDELARCSGHGGLHHGGAGQSAASPSPSPSPSSGTPQPSASPSSSPSPSQAPAGGGYGHGHGHGHGGHH